MPYSDLNEIADPLPGLPLELALRIRPVMLAAVEELRSPDLSYLDARRICTGAAQEIFEVLLSSHSAAKYERVEDLRQEVEVEVGTALECVRYAHKRARPYNIDDESISRAVRDQLRGSEAAEGIETQWWELQATRASARRHGPLPRHHRAPDTPTARRIEEFRRRIEESGRTVYIDDLITFCGYRERSTLERVQRESKGATKTARAAVDRMLACPSAEEFWRVVQANRKKLNPGRSRS